MNARVIRKTVICLASRFHNVFLDRAKNGAKHFSEDRNTSPLKENLLRKLGEVG